MTGIWLTAVKILWRDYHENGGKFPRVTWTHNALQDTFTHTTKQGLCIPYLNSTSQSIFL